ncbi:methylenetetrahydrofolate dehydrogenase (NADP+)/methenyltetrahydrofolate cyclohydrolase [Caldicoprobacter guelmensis]|uniref:bifunctional methylenetetrahydrofolate dehydrogenase/methenyltetrahydrofolate cyclohydrolase FolD n=1 Tax=Caldicoprobacter guelmensis TaxID=1170224 RepID=UPI0019572DE2|nr:bifunctional methylenetetrahydrofolate dehydrogenase/methenyltetrahydrofolate cyclohydrolase FolD [Caldicoprobacter guelmensis]MBM7581295.1 methylenetetrahydrofolate dehydrogenase (NADP+)/methenyltetrahydrofolate cyclohydrolase [Caldicoprobacter guelmensis]
MEARIIDGKKLSERLKEDIKARVEGLKQKGVIPGLAVILVGNDPASAVYVRNKERDCNQVGIQSRVVKLDEDTPQRELLEYIYKLNADPTIHGILVQLPLPPHMDPNAVINAIDPSKDVDGFHPVNMGRLVIGEECFEPCTPKGIIRLIQETGQPIAGKHAVVIGRSNIVGKPVALMLLRHNATVTICHSKTVNLKEITRQADILVVAVGKPNLIDGSFIKPGAIVIDVGINRVEDQLVGDVNFQDACRVAGWITPVPGGVGPMTRTMLLENTILAAEKKWAG